MKICLDNKFILSSDKYNWILIEKQSGNKGKTKLKVKGEVKVKLKVRVNVKAKAMINVKVKAKVK